MLLKKGVALLAVCGIALADVGPCGPEYEDSCKGTYGAEMAQCLKDRQGLNEDCYEWLTMFDACPNEFNMGFCGSACDGESCLYNDDAYECLTEWAPDGDVGDLCVQFLPRYAAAGMDEF